MAYMKDKSGKRLDDMNIAPALSQPGQLISIMRRNQQNAVLNLVGDSTGNETGEWFYKLVVWIGQQFPKYTIVYRLWDDAAQAYLAPTTIQTGTGSRTLSVYNGSHPGAAHDYTFANSNTTRFNLTFPVTPTTVITSYGYNNGLTNYREQMHELTRWITGSFPQAEVILVAQPPKASTDADSANSLLRSADVRAFALQEGYGLIDAAQPFIDYGNFDELIAGDKIHPTAAGMDLWFEQARRAFDPTAALARPRVQPPKVDRIFVPASSFTPNVGTPSMSVSPVGIPKMDFDPATVESASVTVDIPPSWAGVNVWLYWSTGGGSTLGVVWYLDQQTLGSLIPVPASGWTPAGFTAGTKTLLPTIATSGFTRATRMYNNARFAGGRPLVFNIRRDAVDAQDQYASDAWVYGLMIEKSS